jgi:hypothetical protein
VVTTILGVSLSLVTGGVAHAARVSAGFGAELGVNDPFLVQGGPRLDVAWRPDPRVLVGLSTSAYPDLGRGQWTRLTRYTIEEVQATPDISRIAWRALPTVRLVPFSTELPKGRRTEVEVGVGVGVVSTKDDLAALQVSEDPAYEASASQLHPSYGWTVAGTFGARWRARMWAERFTYIERIGGLTLEHKSFLMVGAGVVWVP